MKKLIDITDTNELVKIADNNYSAIGWRINTSLEESHWEYVTTIMDELQFSADIKIARTHTQLGYIYAISVFNVKDYDKLFKTMFHYNLLAYDESLEYDASSKILIAKAIMDLYNDVPTYNILDIYEWDAYLDTYLAQEDNYFVDDEYKLWYKIPSTGKLILCEDEDYFEENDVEEDTTTRRNREQCVEAIEELREMVGDEVIINEINNYFSADEVSDFVDSLRTDYELDQEYKMRKLTSCEEHVHRYLYRGLVVEREWPRGMYCVYTYEGCLKADTQEGIKKMIRDYRDNGGY